VRFAHEPHTRSLADFLVHTLVSAKRVGMSFLHLTRENAVRLETADGTLFPDCSFQLQPSGSQALSFFVELDNGTERVASTDSLDSWSRKLRLYDAYQDGVPSRFRVLVVTTRGHERLRHILDRAAAISPNPRRSLVYGTTLKKFLAAADALRTPCFLDHRGQAVSLIPPSFQVRRHHTPRGSAAPIERKAETARVR
jgi:hypothetical protein